MHRDGDRHVGHLFLCKRVIDNLPLRHKIVEYIYEMLKAEDKVLRLLHARCGNFCGCDHRLSIDGTVAGKGWEF